MRFARKCFGIIMPLLLYVAIAIVYFGCRLYPNLHHQYFGQSGDPLGAIWGLYWWPYAVFHHLNPLFTHQLWSPIGYNLTEAVQGPIVGLALSPLTFTLGVVATYNIAIVLTSALSAYAAFWLCKYVTRSMMPALFGGFLFGFSSYAIAQSLAHFYLTITFFLPLLVLVLLCYLEENIKSITFVILYTLLTVVAFYINPEAVVMFVLFLALLMVCAWFIDKNDRKKIVRFCGWLLLSYVIALFFVSPYLYYFLAHPTAHYVKNPLNNSIAVFNFFIPTTVTWLGGHAFACVSRHYPANLYESSAYLGAPLLVIIALYAKQAWSSKRGMLLMLAFIITAVASLGPFLHFIGLVHPFPIPMPWAIFSGVPVLKDALPVRFILFSSLAVAVIAAYWLKTSRLRVGWRYFWVVASILFLLPSMHSAIHWTTKTRVPAYITSGAYKKEIKRNAVVFTLPYGGDDACFASLWQIRSKMYFRLVNGCLGGEPLTFHYMPIFRQLQHGQLLQSFAGKPLSALIQATNLRQFKALLSFVNASAIWVDKAHFAHWKPVLLAMHFKPRYSKGLYIVDLRRKR
jgi:hypothetical protein